MSEAFTWQDGERTIAFGRGVAERAVELLGGPGYTLLTTPRAAGRLPPVVDAAAVVHHVADGLVEDVAGALLGEVAGERLVALGGGRVIDVTKALVAAARAGGRGAGGDVRAMAVPTTLSGAEMTGGHRHARGIDPATPRVRPALVVCDPALAASQPEPGLVGSVLNALGHAVEAPFTTGANPVATLAAHDAARRIVGAFARPGEPDRDALALGALLAGYALGATGLGLHHVLAQALVRGAGIGHGAANAVMLPVTTAALARRRPAAHAALTAALDEDPATAAARLARRARAATLSDLGVAPEVLPDCARAAAARHELDRTPPRADTAEILALYEAAL